MDPEEPSASTAVGLSRADVLAVATLGVAVNFWAWALLSSLGPACRSPLLVQEPERIGGG